jgi:Tfp pilus assembly protein PilN
MKTEINLRTREFTITRELYWPRLLVTLAVIVLIALFLGGSIFIYLYQMQLAVEIRNLAQEKATLQTRVTPLEELETKIRAIEKRERLAQIFENAIHPWSDHFRMIYRIAGEYGLRVTSLSTTSEGKVIIKGESASMRQISLFMQALVTEQGGGMAVHRHMRYPKNNQFDCEIELTFEAASGGDQ